MVNLHPIVEETEVFELKESGFLCAGCLGVFTGPHREEESPWDKLVDRGVQFGMTPSHQLADDGGCKSFLLGGSWVSISVSIELAFE